MAHTKALVKIRIAFVSTAIALPDNKIPSNLQHWYSKGRVWLSSPHSVVMPGESPEEDYILKILERAQTLKDGIEIYVSKVCKVLKSLHERCERRESGSLPEALKNSLTKHFRDIFWSLKLLVSWRSMAVRCFGGHWCLGISLFVSRSNASNTRRKKCHWPRK